MAEVNKGLKSLVGHKMTKKFKFLDTEIMIHKLSVSQVLAIQATAKEASDKENEGLELVRKVIVAGVEGAEDLSEEDFMDFPLDELTKLSNEIMRFSGVIPEDPKAK